ncbi:hypothetical protein BDA96_09G260900 [Sorghum bicolor]|uniref:Uncharacterized protein n=1 Tax=Sorghum bicolor TaxID=4558 RepID=A0A921U5Z3_SORBI|nr:hypothetical protein BDA96_09G260900 [Sorghum bicolor]
MGLSRRFLNLIVHNRIEGAKSLCSIDLRRHKLFNTTTPAPNKTTAAPKGKALALDKKIRLPSPSLSMRTSDSDLKDRRVDAMESPLPAQSINLGASAMGYSTETCVRKQAAASSITRKIREIQLPQPVMNFRCSIVDSYWTHLPVLPSSTWACTSESKSWQRQLLPPPPFVCDPKHYEHRGPKITSYAVVERGGSHVIFVSVDGAGTYSLDTSHVSDWVLPFTGKVEYVPELKLWFGFCTQDWQLGAADLSTMDSQPQLIAGTWKELEAPGDWRELKQPQLVNLGSGRFCITRFFFRYLHPMSCDLEYDSEYDEPVDEEYFTVLTGVDVVPYIHDAYGTANDTFSGGNGSKGKVELHMIKHNSRRHMSNGSGGTIEGVF